MRSSNRSIADEPSSKLAPPGLLLSGTHIHSHDGVGLLLLDPPPPEKNAVEEIGVSGAAAARTFYTTLFWPA